MFSPSMNEGGPATATRSRRRQRPASNESLAQQPKAKRQRLPLTEQTFVNPDVSAPTGPEMYEVKSDKVAILDTRQDGIENQNPITPTPRKELSVRAKKPKGGDRPTKGDGSIVLTTNNAYTVSKLPALPDRLRADASAQQQADIFSNRYALSLSHTHAIVWPYTDPSQSPETFTFTLPYPSKHTSEPLPLGCLVSPSASSTEPGLVVVMPISGKIAYWESITSAATLDFMKKQRNGVEGSISGMFSGEKVIQITNAESAGFVLAFSSGRLAYMSVRDSHGRPTISVQFLRTNLGSTAGGIFGSIRHALTQTAGRGDIAAVRAERTSRVGERNVVAATLKGRLHAWNVHRGGHHDTIVEADMQEEIIQAIRDVDPSAADFQPETFEVVDFAFVPKGLDAKYRDMSRLSNAMASEDKNLQHLLLLVSFTKKKESHYSLVEVILSPASAQVGMVRPISSYKTRFNPANPVQSTRPRLHLPRPALVAFVVFDKAVVVASIGNPPESPDAQLQEDNHIIPPTYEDVITLSDNNQPEILGSGFEEPQTANTGHEESRSRQKTKNPAVVLMVRGTGIVRLTTTDIDKFGSDQPPKVTPKSKLEQAVFFGNKQDTPLIFDGRKGVQFSDEEVSEAALQLSHEIMSSATSHISSLPASLEDNLSTRCQALDRLMSHLKTTKVKLDRRTRWLLLSHAEKMMVATVLWKRHEAFTNERPANDKKDLIAEIVEFIHQDEKTNPNRSAGEVDRVRHWFVHDVGKLEIFIAWAYEVIKYMYKDHIMDDAKITRLMYEAQQVNLVALMTALEYRQKKLSFYGLEDEELQFGILRDNYDGLAEPWTGCHYICNNLKRLLELSHTWLDQYYPPKEKTKDKTKQPDPALLEKINSEIANLSDLYLVSLLEASRWNAVQQDAKAQKWSEHLSKLYDSNRNDKVLSLLRLGKWDESINIAEKHRCWRALALAMIEQINSLRSEATVSRSQVDARELTKQAELKEKQIGVYFDKYGEAFAFPTYDILLDNAGVQAVLDFSHDNHGYRTNFLRTKPELAKISWINDIQRERDIGHAAETLFDLGITREQQVWNKKIELSLGKLALLAESEKPAPSDLFGFKQANVEVEGTSDEKIEIIDDQLHLIKIQDQLYAQIFPSVQMAVDESAELQLAMENHCLHIPKKQKALIQVFESSMRRLLKHEALDAMSLIDLLTLVHLPDETAADIDDPFYLALEAASLGLKGEESKMAKCLIWRRCFIRDDWTKLNDTQLKDDSFVGEKLTRTTLFSAFISCYQKQRIDEPFQPTRPSDALGAFVDDLDARWASWEKSYRDKLLDAMKWEDSVLRKYIDKARLEEWTRTTAESAETLVADSVDEATRAATEDIPDLQTNGKANGLH